MIDLRLGNCLELIKTLDDNSIDAIITDPPYEIGFMNKGWDNTGIAYNIELWKECLRVLKHGGYLLAFSSPRTYHRMACAIEDAGFFIANQLGWIFGSGFPKGLNISKGIDKKLGLEREIMLAPTKKGNKKEQVGDLGFKLNGFNDISQPISELAKLYDGYNTQLKPAHEPICMAQKPFEKGMNTVENIMKYATGAMNIDACRVGNELIKTSAKTLADGVFVRHGFPGHQCDESFHYGRYPANIIHDGSDEVLDVLKDYSRFFYCAKASVKDRNEGLDESKNIHPTVKPTELMKYLVKLVTPPKEFQPVVLDIFMGSGSTGKACANLGINFIGFEMNSEYLEIANARINHELNKENQEELV